MNAAEQPLVYVLTPVYNGEKYLAECIESVLAQTYQNWEYCILNNRSTDSSREIAEAYAKKDQRISVRDTSELLNHLANHNLGLCQIPAGSRYCKVVHADDWLFPECLTKMVEIAESNPKISLVGAYGLRNVGVSWGGVAYNT
ncbi:MAG: glycosyltransferase family 2 protein, partial [Nitrospiraceae bacterium]